MKQSILSFAMLLCLAGCKKSDSSFCIECEEAKTKLKVESCGTQHDNDLFESTLKKDGAASGQVWTCSRK